jgi:hypothetical protein
MQTHHPQELKKLLSKYDSAYLDHIEKLDFDERVKIAAKNPDLLYILYDDEYEYEKIRYKTILSTTPNIAPLYISDYVLERGFYDPYDYAYHLKHSASKAAPLTTIGQTLNRVQLWKLDNPHWTHGLSIFQVQLVNEVSGLFQSDEDLCYKLVEQLAHQNMDYEKARTILEPYLKDISYEELKECDMLTYPWKSNPVEALNLN